MTEHMESPDILTLGVLNVDIVMELSHKIIGGKIIGEELNPKRQAEVVEKIIEEAEDSSWKE